jgi:hypothetical protein
MKNKTETTILLKTSAVIFKYGEILIHQKHIIKKWINHIQILYLTVLLSCVNNVYSQIQGEKILNITGQQTSIYQYCDAETRWASPENWKGEKGAGGIENNGRKGSPCFTLKSGEKKILAEVNGYSGMIRRIWITISDLSPEMLRGIKLIMFWDNAGEPAVLAPLGDFFGHGLGQMKTFENAFFACPEGKSFNCYIPMPFKMAMKIIAVNESDNDLDMFYYDIDYTLGDRFNENTLYFHAWFNHQSQTEFMKDYEILPLIVGKGRFLGANISVAVNTAEYLRTWWGEGEVKIYLDGDRKYPTLCGTGTEDYIGTGWGQSEYSQAFQGCTIADKEKMQYAFYRYHVPDPVYFHQDIKVTIQQIGYVGKKDLNKLEFLKNLVYETDGKRDSVLFYDDPDGFLFERRDDISSCAYFYFSEPYNNLLNTRIIK